MNLTPNYFDKAMREPVPARRVVFICILTMLGCIVLAALLFPLYAKPKEGSHRKSANSAYWQNREEARRRNRELFMAGVAAMKARDYPEAKRQFLAAEKLIKGDFQSWAMMGRVCRLTGDLESSRVWYQQIVEGVPNMGSTVQKDVSVLYEYFRVSEALHAETDRTRALELILEHGVRVYNDEEPFALVPKDDNELVACSNIVLAKSYTGMGGYYEGYGVELEESDRPKPRTMLEDTVRRMPDWTYAHYYLGLHLANFESESRENINLARQHLTRARAGAPPRMLFWINHWMTELNAYGDG